MLRVFFGQIPESDDRVTPPPTLKNGGASCSIMEAPPQAVVVVGNTYCNLAFLWQSLGSSTCHGSAVNVNGR